MLDAKATFSPYPETFPVGATLALPDPEPPPPFTAAASTGAASDERPRPVTPRRLLRFKSARSSDNPQASIAAPNIFSGVFDSEEALTDNRLKRSRTRMRTLLAAHEARLSEVERNLWHDDPPFAPAPDVVAPQPVATSTDTRSDGTPTGRRIRHLKAADIARPPRPPVNDPLRLQLAAVREALYAPDPDAPPPTASLSVPSRLTVQVLNLILVIIALPLGLAVAAVTFWRGENLRLSAGAITAAGLVSTILPDAPFPFV